MGHTQHSQALPEPGDYPGQYDPNSSQGGRRTPGSQTSKAQAESDINPASLAPTWREEKRGCLQPAAGSDPGPWNGGRWEAEWQAAQGCEKEGSWMQAEEEGNRGCGRGQARAAGGDKDRQAWASMPSPPASRAAPEHQWSDFQDGCRRALPLVGCQGSSEAAGCLFKSLSESHPVRGTSQPQPETPEVCNHPRHCSAGRSQGGAG